jgi:multidrug efflux system outer membrane protein
LQNAAFENAQAAEEARQAATLSLTTAVAQSYLALCELDERLALARQTEASRVESTRIFSRRVEVGSSSRLQLTQMQTLLTQAQALVVQLAQARASLVQTLTLLVGAPLDLPERANALSSQPPIAQLRSGLPSELLQARPDIVAAEHQLRAAHAQVGAARAAFFPSITLTTVLGNTSEDLDKLFKSDSRAWLFSPSINLPLFDGGRRQNNLDLQEARRNEAVAQYEKSIQTAFREVNDALGDSHWLQVQQGIAEAAVQAQSERARLSQRRFDAGSATFLEVLDAQRDLLAASQQLVQVRRAVLASRVTLYAALGGGSLAQRPQP